MPQKNKSNFREYRCMLKLINSAVNKSNADISDCMPNWSELFNLSKDASLVNLVSYGIDKLPKEQMPPANVLSLFFQYRSQYLVKDSNQLYELEKLTSELEKHSISHMPVKGSFIKYDYPQTDMRYMGDIDILIKEEDVTNADSVLNELGYKNLSHGKDIHDEYEKPPFIMLELHKKLISDDDPAYDYLSNIWDRAALKKDCFYSYIPTKEDIYIHMIAHGVNHYFFGGIAPRIVLDFYVFLEKNKNKLNFQYVKDVVSQMGYEDFTEKISKLAYEWFSPVGTGLNNDDLSMFIVSSGSYGRMKNNVLIKSAQMSKKGKAPSPLMFAFKQAFPSIKIMGEIYPVLKRHHFLLPFMWIRRIFTKLFFRRNGISTTDYYGDINEENIERMRNINSQLGLDKQNNK